MFAMVDLVSRGEICKQVARSSESDEIKLLCTVEVEASGSQVYETSKSFPQSLWNGPLPVAEGSSRFTSLTTAYFRSLTS